MSNNMQEDFGPDLINLIDDDGVEHSFEVIDAIETEDGNRYMALMPYSGNMTEMLDESLYYIFEVVESDGEEQLVTIDDEDLLDSLAEIFEERFEEIFEDGDDEIVQ